MPDKRWKRAEREIAERLSGVRIPLLGRKGSDLDVPYLFVEVKSRKSIAGYLWAEYFEQILEGLELSGDDRIPAIAIHRPGMRYDDALVCVRAGDWQRLIQKIKDDLQHD